MEKYLDKNKIPFKHKDIVRINPDDDDWLDIVYKLNPQYFDGEFELGNYLAQPNPVTNVKLLDVIYGTENPCVIVGNLETLAV